MPDISHKSVPVDTISIAAAAPTRHPARAVYPLRTRRSSIMSTSPGGREGLKAPSLHVNRTLNIGVHPRFGSEVTRVREKDIPVLTFPSPTDTMGNAFIGLLLRRCFINWYDVASFFDAGEFIFLLFEGTGLGLIGLGKKSCFDFRRFSRKNDSCSYKLTNSFYKIKFSLYFSKCILITLLVIKKKISEGKICCTFLSHFRFVLT